MNITTEYSNNVKSVIFDGDLPDPRIIKWRLYYKGQLVFSRNSKKGMRGVRRVQITRTMEEVARGYVSKDGAGM